MSPLYTVIGLVVLAALVVLLLKTIQKDNIDAFVQKRKASSKIATRAEYVEGAQRIPVALSLAQDAIHYENPDLEASFDLNRLDEIEYTDELATGKSVEDHYKVLRLRSHGTAFEFLLERQELPKWEAELPPTYRQPTARAM